MKDYELIDKLEKEIGWMGYKYEQRKNQVCNLKGDLKKMKAHHQEIERSLIHEIEHQEKDLEQLHVYQEDLRKKLSDARKAQVAKPKPQPKPQPKPEPEPEPEPVKKVEIPPEPEPPKPEKPEPNGNGKITCDICNEEFHPQGYPSHRGYCEKKKRREELLKEIEKLGGMEDNVHEHQ